MGTIWSDLISNGIAEDNDCNEKGFKRYMMGTYYLFQYSKNAASLGQSFGEHSSTCRGEPLWRWIFMIAKLKDQKIVWPSWFDEPNAEKFIVVKDGKDVSRWEKKNPRLNRDKKYYSHKYNCCALKWELATAVHCRQIVWMSGPFRGGKGDGTIYIGEEDADDEELPYVTNLAFPSPMKA